MNYANEPLTENGDDISSKTLNELICKYESIVYDYLAIMNSSETVKSMDSAKYTIQLGLSAITHIYKLAFCTTKNVATSADHCQKGIYCFIEYIEQTYKLGYINQTGSSQFDYMDAITFIYDKTMPDLTLDERTGSSSFANMISATYMADFLRCKSVLEQFGRVASVLLWFNHPTICLTDQMEIVDSHLIDFLGYHSVSSKPKSHDCSLNKDVFLFLETVQETAVGMEKTEYLEFLVSLKKQMKKQEKKGIDTMAVLPACLYLKGADLSSKVKRGDLAKLPF